MIGEFFASMFAALAGVLRRAPAPVEPAPLPRKIARGDVICMIHGPAQMTDRDRAVWPVAFTTLAVKLLDGTTRQDVSVAKYGDRLGLLDEAEAHGRARFGWAYVYARTQAEARLEAEAAARVIAERRLGIWAYNAEKHWAGCGWKVAPAGGKPGVPMPVTIDPEAAILAYVRHLRELAPDVELVDVKFSQPWTTYFPGGQPRRAMTTDATLSATDIWAPMVYEDDPKDWRGRIDPIAARAASLGVRLAPVVASGRDLGKPGDGRAYGTPVELLDSARDGKLYAAIVYLGNLGAGMVADGHADHPPWKAYGPALGAAIRGGT